MTTTHTLTEALKKFDLISGVGDGKQTACAMSMLAWIDGCKDWTDAPVCAHPIIRDQVIRANDAADTTPAMRSQLVRAGRKGILDTWWIPVEVIAWCLSGEKGKEPPTQFDRTLATIKRIAEWKKDKVRPNLSGANLSGAYLYGADLSGAYLRGADLYGAYLYGADLSGANLSGAYLSGADLSGAYLYGANLSGADLSGAYLRGADLSGAYLRGADLYGADLSGANLYGAYLSGAKGTPLGGIPKGWKLDDSGFYVKA